MLRSYGWRERSVSEILGYNSRLDELQAAFLRVRLQHLDHDNERRRQLAAVYAEALAEIAELAPSSVPDGVEPVWHVYPVVIPERARIQAALDRAGIGTLVHYDPLPHLTPAFRAAGWSDGDFPVAERLAASELSMPFYPQLPAESAVAVGAALVSALG